MQLSIAEDSPVDVHVQLDAIEEKIALAREEFGEKNTLLTHYNYLRLAILLHYCDATQYRLDILRTLARISSLIFGVERVTAVSRRGASSYTQGYRYVFPKSSYDGSYQRAAVTFRSAIRDRVAFSTNHQYLLNRFVYVVSTKEEWRYCIIPQSARIALVGNRDLSAMPFHPILAEDWDLEVAVAGEIAFEWASGSREPTIVLANNVSGHFKPLHWRADHLNDTMRQCLALSNEVSVLTIANDGCAISGPLAQALNLL